MGQSLADQVYETLKNEIITCVLAPGQQIAQPELAEKHQVGITPIREALQRLAQEGLVQPFPRFGYVVTPITLSDVVQLFELRTILESAAVRLAVQRASEAQLDKIAELADYTYVHKDYDSYARFLANNADFHRLVAVVAGNPKLAESISRLLDELTRVFHLGIAIRDSAEEMRIEHKMLVEALRKRDPDEAERIVQAQITRSQQLVLEALVPAAGGMSSTLGQTVQIRPS